jgi:hypothetical protein
MAKIVMTITSSTKVKAEVFFLSFDKNICLILFIRNKLKIKDNEIVVYLIFLSIDLGSFCIVKSLYFQNSQLL